MLWVPLADSLQILSDIHILGGSTESLAICSLGSDEPDWLCGSPVCALLSQHHILHAGIMTARQPFQVIRSDQSGTFFLACFGGSGSILSDGGWKPVKAGEACLLPPHTVNALKVGRSKKWEFAWVRYLEPRGVVPVATANSPARGGFDPKPLRFAIQGLHAEAGDTHRSVATQHHWVELIHGYVARFATPMHADERVWKAWEKVAADLGNDWTLDSIASISSLSAEHFRRLCLKALGRSPMKHLTFLRMRHAAELLTTSEAKVETVARLVGYENPFAFSNTFLKWIGVRPSEHRGEGLGDE
ncbi:MAG: AraC-like DNA-binding protein [Verrucomicrobiales bacterium]|jgi:AraC-like DNA-binding protein